jgi:hypothetical protein
MKMEHHKPELSHYPKFFRELISESYLMHGLIPLSCRRDDPLYKVFIKARIDPLAEVCLELSVELAREKFDKYEMWMELERLKERIKKLEKNK